MTDPGFDRLGKKTSLARQQNPKNEETLVENECHTEKLKRFLAKIDAQGDFPLKFELEEGQPRNGMLAMSAEIRNKRTCWSVAKAFGMGKDQESAKNSAAMRLLAKFGHLEKMQQMLSTSWRRETFEKRRRNPSESEEKLEVAKRRKWRTNDLPQIRQENVAIERKLGEQKTKPKLLAEEKFASQFEKVYAELEEENGKSAQQIQKLGVLAANEVENPKEREAEMKGLQWANEKLRHDCGRYLNASNRYLIWMSEYEHLIKTACFPQPNKEVETYLD